MTYKLPPPNFEEWFRESVGVSFDGAKQRGAWDLKLIAEAFEAGRAYAIAAIEAQGVPENRCITELKAYAEANPGTYIFPHWDGQRVAKYLASAPPAPQAKPQPLSDEQKDAVLSDVVDMLSKQHDWLMRTSAINLVAGLYGRTGSVLAHGITKE